MKNRTVFTSWWVQATDETVYAIYSVSDNTLSLTDEKNFFADKKFLPGLITYVNNPEKILMVSTGADINACLESGSGEAYETAKALTVGMSEDEILNMNPVLQFLYVKK